MPARDPLVPTVFHNRWWLEAASDGKYRETEVRSDGRVVARFPYMIQRGSFGYRMSTMPDLTHFLGPAIDHGTGNAVNRSLREFHITQELLAQVTPSSGFYHKLHRGIGDTLAFEDAGCTSLVQFTYEIAPKSEDEIWRGMRDKTRNVIRRAAERWRVVTLHDPQAFAAIYEANLGRRGLVNEHRHIPAVCAAAIAHGHGHVLAVRDRGGATLGAVFVAWDHAVAYYLLATRAPGSDNGVMSLLVWHAIRDATARGLMFDFDGLGTPGSRVFYTGFGGRIAPRYIATRFSLGHRVANSVARALHRRPGM